MNRLFLTAVSLAAFIFCGSCRRQEAAPETKKPASSVSDAPAGDAPPAAEQVKFELELLRAPVLTVAEAMFNASGDPAGDAALREHLLATGATSVLRCGVSGPSGQELKDEKLEITQEPTMWEFASHWQMDASAAKDGEEVEKFEDVSLEDHEQGYSLTASLVPGEAGVFAKIQFRWLGPPVVRLVKTWPVQGRTARVIQDRKWEMSTDLILAGNQPHLLAAAPEPPDADGNPTGFLLMAFGKAAVGKTSSHTNRPPAPRTLQCWTLEVPAAAAHQWLSRRAGSGGDEAELKKLLGGAGQKNGTSLSGFEVLCDYAPEDSGDENSFVDSRLAWIESRGFEPADTRYVPFIPVPNEGRSESVVQRLETGYGEASLTLPVGGVKWTRWHGSTRGALDEPAGVESSATGYTQCEFLSWRESGRVFLANAHTCGPLTRLTFAEVFSPVPSFGASRETTITVMETPVEPWLPRLVAGADLTSLLPELTAAENGTVIHEEVCTTYNGRGWKREDTWPWLSFSQYLNPSIHDGKFCFNPRSVTGTSLACRMEAESPGALAIALSGEPVSRRFGLWLTGVAGYSAETSGISLSEWPQLTLSANGLTIPAHDRIQAVSFGRSWRLPDRPVIHWVIVRGAAIPGSEPADPTPPAPPQTVASFTITDASGTVIEYVTLPAGINYTSFTSGHQIQSLQPRAVARKYYFTETVPPEIEGAGQRMSGQPEIVQTFDGTEVQTQDGQWAVFRSREPVHKITETFIALTEERDTTMKDIPVSCERLVLRQETLTGTLPAPGASATQSLEGGRQLTVRVR